MSDLTPLFKQCVSIVQDKFGDSIKEDYDLKQSRKDSSEDRYIIKDTLNNSLLYVEGFVFSPSQRKRDKMIELEAVIKSMVIGKR